MECKHLLHAGFNWKGLSTTFFQGVLEMMESSGRKWVSFPRQFPILSQFPKTSLVKTLVVKTPVFKKAHRAPR